MAAKPAHLITGAASGIGAIVAERLAKRGDQLWLLARNEVRAKELEDRFPDSRTLVADLSEPRRLAEVLENQDMPTRLDSLLHIAGVVDVGAVAELDSKVWNVTLAVNLAAPAELTRLLLPQVRTAQGHIIFLNSRQGLRANATWSAYAASKHGLRALADALREEEHDSGVRVTSIHPSRTATPMLQKVHRQEEKEYDATRWIRPESVATTVLTALDQSRDAEITDLTIGPGR
ncbi:SDR family oxidoreductase [Amycolatopsis sp. NPDC049868]|uniref:SDR family oxidoreductase n=1 Tax=Amycolatopsis sp. NPDC049868 TaxID=3363934 RepID=UPI0037A568C3